ncbi:acyl carrier protein [Streptomyces sp. NPDC004779]|uniref:acyl carrier protein n=1 Tax=Streptomyces sp. NPDC056049 TaxID=3345693 RepID=UPI0035E33BEC
MTNTPAAVGTDAVSAIVSGMVQLIAPRKVESVGPDQRLIGDLGFHSLVLAELGYNLEELYGLRSLNPEEAMRLQNVGDVIELVRAEVAAGQAQLAEAEVIEDVFARYGVESPLS